MPCCKERLFCSLSLEHKGWESEMENFTERNQAAGLYEPQFEHDAFVIGAVVDIKGRKSHQTVSDALTIV